MNYEENIGKRVHKHKSGKPFKSWQKINTVKGVIDHPEINVPAYTFEDDDSYVECRRCEVVKTYFQNFTNGLCELAEIIYDRKKQSEVIMLYRFIELMTELDFNLVYNMYFLEEEDFDQSWYNFHKSMRNSDFYSLGEGSGHADMLFWNFIHLTDVPYKLMKVFTEKTKAGTWDKFGLYGAIRSKSYEKET
jgi:hypothetical protein